MQLHETHTNPEDLDSDCDGRTRYNGLCPNWIGKNGRLSVADHQQIDDRRTLAVAGQSGGVDYVTDSRVGQTDSSGSCEVRKGQHHQIARRLWRHSHTVRCIQTGRESNMAIV